MNTQQQLDALKLEIEKLKKTIEAFNSSSTIPIQFERALGNRGFIDTFEPDFPAEFGAVIDADVGINLEILVPNPGDTITVPQFPYKFLKIKDRDNLYVPVYTY